MLSCLYYDFNVREHSDHRCKFYRISLLQPQHLRKRGRVLYLCHSTLTYLGGVTTSCHLQVFSGKKKILS